MGFDQCSTTQGRFPYVWSPQEPNPKLPDSHLSGHEEIPGGVVGREDHHEDLTLARGGAGGTGGDHLGQTGANLVQTLVVFKPGASIWGCPFGAPMAWFGLITKVLETSSATFSDCADCPLSAKWMFDSKRSL